MVNTFRAVQPKLQEIEAIVNAVPVKTQPAKNIVWHILRHIEDIETLVDKAEKYEMNR